MVLACSCTCKLKFCVKTARTSSQTRLHPSSQLSPCPPAMCHSSTADTYKPSRDTQLLRWLASCRTLSIRLRHCPPQHDALLSQVSHNYDKTRHLPQRHKGHQHELTLVGAARNVEQPHCSCDYQGILITCIAVIPALLTACCFCTRCCACSM